MEVDDVMKLLLVWVGGWVGVDVRVCGNEGVWECVGVRKHVRECVCVCGSMWEYVGVYGGRECVGASVGACTCT